MRKYILGIFILYSLIGQCQNTWFKVYPNQTFGTSQSNLLQKEDTLYHIYNFANITGSDIAIDKVDMSSGATLNLDTLSYFNSSGLYTSHQSFFDEKGQLFVGFHYVDSTINKWQNVLYNVSVKEPIQSSLNIDTFVMGFSGVHHFGDDIYLTTLYKKDRNKYQQQLWKGEIDKAKQVIYTSAESASCESCHRHEFINLIENIVAANSLFLVQMDLWNYRGTATNWEADIIKLDTSGNLLWTCRPNIRDSFCTSFPTVVQKPNGNLIVSWLDQWRKAYMSESQVPYETVNKDMTLWFAEIDHQTGKVLWRKNISQYLDWKTKKDIAEKGPNYRDIYIKSAKLLDDNSIVWAGDCTYGKDTFDWTSLGVLLKTDLDGNPIWYREYELYPDDLGDKGLKIHSFVEAPDGGFILAGEYENRSNAEWQHAALLKVDEYGCYEPGCQETDAIASRVKIYKQCKVYTNPADDRIRIEFPEKTALTDWKITMQNATGQSVGQMSEQYFDISEYSNGIYFINIQNLKIKHYETHKIIIER